jgi:transposase-like protein
VDKVGRTIDFYPTERRDVNAVKHFFRKAMKSVGPPRVITLHAYAASYRAVRELKSEGQLPRLVRVRSSKYPNNVIEQDHRRIKQLPICCAATLKLAGRDVANLRPY